MRIAVGTGIILANDTDLIVVVLGVTRIALKLNRDSGLSDRTSNGP